MKLISWNVAGRSGVLAAQAEALARQEPDLVCLQEVRATTLGRWSEALAEIGLGELEDSSEFIGPRRFFNLTASRWALRQLAPIGAPQPERVLSLAVQTPHGALELHNVHVPPAQSAGLVKVETCEAIHFALARPSDRHRVLCGDFNLPKLETAEGEVITFAANRPEWLQRWDAAERSILTGLAEWGMVDVFRALHGYERQDASWVFNTRARRKSAHRLDHILASSGLNPVWCDYHHGWREAGLSDHSAIEGVFEPQPTRRRQAMTTKADFNAEEWEQILQAPALAGLVVITAQRGGTIRESVQMAKAYTEARKEHAGSDLLSEIVAHPPTVDTRQFESAEQLRSEGLQRIRDAVALLEPKAEPGDVEAYKRFVLTVAERAAEATKSGGVLGIGGERVSDAESAALDELAAALGTERGTAPPTG
jgi:exonuclease III